MRRCKLKSCGKAFEPSYSSLQKCCSPECAIALARMDSDKKAKGEWQKEKKERKEKLMTTSDWLQLLQMTFNTYIRIRDKFKPCISCQNPLTGKYDAGHFYSVGSYPNLRFEEDNVHGQCVHCNQHKSGNIAEYSIRLPERIGQERFQALQEKRNGRLSLSVDQIKEMIQIYKMKIKDETKKTA